MSRLLWVVFALLVVTGTTILWQQQRDLPVPKVSLANQAGSSPRSPGEPPVKAKPQPAVDAPEPVTDSLSPPAFLDEHTLVNTTWGRGGFELELAQGGVLRIGGKERARWQVIGSRIRLYDRRGEEHWLDIVDDRVTWNGQEVSRIR